MAITGVVSLSGHMLCVGQLKDKAKGALECGVKLVVAPCANKYETKEKAQIEETETGQASVDWDKVAFVVNVVDLLEHTVKGECIKEIRLP